MLNYFLKGIPESLHLWRLLFSGHGLRDDKMFFGDYGLLDLFSRFFVVLLS